jgi:hypothetical protein
MTWAYELNRDSAKEEVHMANKYGKKCSISLVIKEMQTKIIIRFHLTPVRMAKMNAIKDGTLQETL